MDEVSSKHFVFLTSFLRKRRLLFVSFSFRPPHPPRPSAPRRFRRKLDLAKRCSPPRRRLNINTVNSLKPSRKAPHRFTFSSTEKGDRYPLWVVVDEVLFSICNLLLWYTSSVTRFYCLTQFLTLWCVPPRRFRRKLDLAKRCSP